MGRPLADTFDAALRRRLLTGSVLAALVLVAILAGGPVFTIFLIALAAAMARELARLLEREARLRLLLTAGILTAALVGLPALHLFGWRTGGTALLALALLVAAMGGAAGRRPLVWFAGTLYLLVPLAALLWLRHAHLQGAVLVLWLFIVIVATDTGAYLVGRTVGGPKLAPRISPGKTWSGLAGGVAAAGILGGVAVRLGGEAAPPSLAAAVVAMLLAVVAQGGDLVESALKRRSGVKDSGTLLPGHGGVLDRFDGVLFAAPCFALLVALLDLSGGEG